jgi:hypothetical protein
MASIARGSSAKIGAPLKHEMSLEAIAAAENTTPAAIHMCLSRALRKLRKLRKEKLLITARELALELEAHRATANSVRTGRRAR